MPLYYVQDGDRPMHVLAKSWQGAVFAWRNRCCVENEGTSPAEHDPQGIMLVAENDDIIVTIEAHRDLDNSRDDSPYTNTENSYENPARISFETEINKNKS